MDLDNYELCSNDEEESDEHDFDENEKGFTKENNKARVIGKEKSHRKEKSKHLKNFIGTQSPASDSGGPNFGDGPGPGQIMSPSSSVQPYNIGDWNMCGLESTTVISILDNYCSRYTPKPQKNE